MRGLKLPGMVWECRYNKVASFTDAWIETAAYMAAAFLLPSHLLQMRGLKQYKVGETFEEKGVASFTDAWIET